MTLTAVAYLRISSDPFDTRFGVERQQDDVQRLADQLGAELGSFFEDDDVSAFTERKSTTAWARCLAAIEKDRPDFLLVFKQDRIGRRLTDVEGLEELCRHTGTRVVAVHGGDVFSNPAWPFIAAQAKTESMNTSLRVRRAHDDRRKAGLSVNGGIRPYAFERDRVTVVQREAAVLRELADRVIGGESLTSLVRELNRREEPTVRGARWSVSVLRNTLSNPRYAGLLARGSGSKREVIGSAAWPAVFDPATWEALQGSLVRVQRESMGAPRRSLLSGLVRCAICLTPMVAMGAKGRSIYRCNSHVGGCGRTSRSRRLLDDYVVREALAHSDTDLLLDEKERAFRDLRGMSSRYEAVRWKLDDASWAHREGRLESRDFYPLYDDLRAQRGRLEKLLGKARQHLEEVKATEAARVEFERWPDDKKRSWLRSQIVTVIVRQPGRGSQEVDPETVDIEYRV